MNEMFSPVPSRFTDGARTAHVTPLPSTFTRKPSSWVSVIASNATCPTIRYTPAVAIVIRDVFDPVSCIVSLSYSSVANVSAVHVAFDSVC